MMEAIGTGGGWVAMESHSNEAYFQRDEGFTLIEMMVVLLIMAILLAVAIPTFLGTTKGAEDREAQSNLTNALIASKSIYVQQNGYPTSSTMVTDLGKQEPELKYINATLASTAVRYSSASTKISVYASGASSSNPNGTKLVISDYSSQSGVCWIVKDLQTTTTTTKFTTGGTLKSLTAGDWYTYKVTSKATTCYAAKFKTAYGTAHYTSSYPPLNTGH